MLKKSRILCSLLFLLILQLSVANAETGSLKADSISYNVNTKKAEAKGNVVIKKETATMWGEIAQGNTETFEFTIKGNVRGEFPEDKAEMKADSVKWVNSSEKNNNIVEAFGKVLLTREPKDRLRAEYVRWETETTNYLARGNVDGIFQNKILKATEAGRTESTFWGKRVIRYEDMSQKIGFAAETIDGTLLDNEIQTAIARSFVTIDYIDADGVKSVVTGDLAEYSKARGTVIVSGKAKMVRSDGKTANADRFILYENTKNIEAIGNTQMVFDLSDEKKKKE
ncbi:MAG: LPS export ABC transporter periplasmic protein LptC [Synergistaceae bacterium]|nr:LPS export ABC transporter periplasmic protein LptC [Synergistaceae bacterium]